MGQVKIFSFHFNSTHLIYLFHPNVESTQFSSSHQFSIFFLSTFSFNQITENMPNATMSIVKTKLHWKVEEFIELHEAKLTWILNLLKHPALSSHRKGSPDKKNTVSCRKKLPKHASWKSVKCVIKYCNAKCKSITKNEDQIYVIDWFYWIELE